jgi:hypothetical protein
LEHGLVEALPALTRAIYVYDFILGIRSHRERKAIEKVQQLGFAENHPLLMYFRLEEVDILEAHPLVKQKLVELLKEIENQGDLELQYWTCSRIAELDQEDENTKALAWRDKAIKIAQANNDDILLKLAQAEALWSKVSFGVQEESILDKLQELLAFFEPEFPDSFAVYILLWSLSAHLLTILDFDGALTYGKRCLNVAISWQDLAWITRSEYLLAYINLRTNQPRQAAGHLNDCLDWHLAIGERWQTLGFLYGTCINMAHLICNNPTAISILSYTYHHPESFPNYKENIERERSRLKDALGSEAFMGAWEKGKELDFDMAVAMFKEALEKVSSDQSAATSDQ